MPAGSPSSGGFRDFLKRRTRDVKKVLRPEVQASTPQTTSPQPQPSSGVPSELAPAQERLPPPPSQSQQPVSSSQPTPSPGQPVPTASHVAVNNLRPANTESTLARVAKGVGEDAWTGLKGALQLVGKSSNVLPPLKSAVVEFLGVVDIFETASQNQKDYEALASNLQNMVQKFAERPGEQASSKMLEALDAMVNGLQQEVKHVQEQDQRSGVRRFLQVKEDSDDVQECYNRVENLRRALQDKAMLRMWSIGEEQQVDARLKDLNAALQAMYDSSLSDVVGRRKCTPGTRESILAGMRKWIDDPKSPNVYWLNGMAGTGKTTLAYSFSAEMQNARRLGASFFCSRADAECRAVAKIVPTIAHQLARFLPSYREALIRQIGEDKEVGARRIETQFEKLIRDPLLEVQASVPEGIVVMIDALDECERREGAQDILDALLTYARDLPIKFFITCRPEPGLFDVLQSGGEHCRSVLHLHEIEASFVQADIKIYLEAELSATSLSQQKLEQLAEQAGTLFIYAATAVRYIHPKGRRVNFHRRLEDLLSVASKTGSDKHKGIDTLYAAVLAAPFDDEDLSVSEKEIIRLVLDTAICARVPISVSTMAKLLELDDEDILCALQHLRSVLHISQGTDLISTLHASFPDFMLDSERSKHLRCNAVEHNRLLSLHCFSTMQRLLRFNICELDSSFVLDENVPDLGKKIDKAIFPELFYACRYWGDHLGFAEALGSVHSALEEFLARRLLFWMEVLNLRNCIGAGAQMLAEVHTRLQKLGGTDNVLELALDAGRFVTAFGLSPASRSTPHIYISMLPFWAETRPVRQQYWKQTRGLISLEGPAIQRRDLSCLATWNTASLILCVAFSLDDTRIVSGSYDNTISVWDAHSGALVVGPFQGHAGCVRSVGFSPDGIRIVSGADDRTICVWDSRSGALVAGPFVGHDHTVRSVGFSPDGTLIVSGSHDNTIRVWDAQSGDLVVGPFEGHTSSVNSVAFSRDGTRIASGSGDHTIGMWDARSGTLVTELFEGHTDWVRSVGFSPDGNLLASGSEDKTIRVWDAHSGALVAGPFEGHSRPVNSVGFSSDGIRIVSGSEDHTVRVWDARSGDLVAGPFNGHTGGIYCVMFSPSSTRIVSGSADRTIRVWDARSGVLIAGSFEGHTGWVFSICFSPDGTRIVSGSWDGTIRVWDASNGALVVGLFEGHTDWVRSVSFSPDGARIVSGSRDNTIRVWDACSGLMVAGPFEGHTSSVDSVGFSPDGTLIASGSRDNTIRVWDAYSGDLTAGPFEGHSDSINSIAFSPDSTRLVSGSSDNTICVWDARSGALMAEPFQGHTDWVQSVGFSSDGALIVSGSNDHTIRVWDAHSGGLVAGPFLGHTDWVQSVGFSSDGTRIISSSRDSTIRVWDASSGDLVDGPFEGHTGPVRCVAFSPDNTRIASGCDDFAIRVWDAAPLPLDDSGDFADWLIDDKGMVTTQQGQLLLCVPVDLWIGLMRPRNPVCIHRKGALKLDFFGVLMGTSWVKCYHSR